MVRKIVAFVGEIGAGKSTCARAIAVNGFARISFADPLKEMLITMGLTSSDVYGDDKQKPNHLLGGKTPRHAMQTLGTEWGRDMIHPNLWIYAWRRRIDELDMRRQVVVDDARFPNEFALLKEMDTVFVEVQRPDLMSMASNHVSENYRVVPDYMLLNNGDLPALRKKLNRLMLEIMN